MYYDNGRLQTEILPNGNAYSYAYDEKGNVIERRFKQDASQEDSSDDLVVSTVYDPVFDLPIQITSPRGVVTDFELDTSGNITQVITHDVDTGNGAQDITTIHEYDAHGRLTQTTDPENRITQYTYSGAHMVESRQ